MSFDLAVERFACTSVKNLKTEHKVSRSNYSFRKNTYCFTNTIPTKFGGVSRFHSKSRFQCENFVGALKSTTHEYEVRAMTSIQISRSFLFFFLNPSKRCGCVKLRYSLDTSLIHRFFMCIFSSTCIYNAIFFMYTVIYAFPHTCS